MLNNLVITIIPYIIILVIASERIITANRTSSVKYPENNKITDLLPSAFKPILDTVFILGDSFLEISLKEQIVIINRRNDSSLKLKISTGNSSISKGKDTPAGIYSVQSKSRLATSKQFNNAKLINWVGFNYNIGFHGLEGNSYYRTLGIRPSSHGCVRIGREDGDTLYKYVKIGTPIMVFDNSPAMKMAFGKSENFKFNRDYKLKIADKSSLKYISRRLKNLYSGKYYTDVIGRIYMDGQTALRPGGFDIGSRKKISKPQQLPYYYPYISDFKSISCDISTDNKELKLLSKIIND